MVAGMIRELSTLQNLLCGQGRKTGKKLSFMIKLVSYLLQMKNWVFSYSKLGLTKPLKCKPRLTKLLLGLQ